MTKVIALHPGPPVLAFDGDAAGRDSAYRRCLAAARQGRAVAVTVLPDDHDPASWLAKRADEGLSAWVRDGAVGPGRRGPKPVPAATYVGSYLASQQGVNDIERMEAIVAASRCAELLPERQAPLWVDRIAAIAGRLAVAEALDHVAEAMCLGTVRATQEHFHGNRRPLPAMEFAVGCGEAAALVERVAAWGRRLPPTAAQAFLRSASAALENGGIAGARLAALHLGHTFRRVEQTIEPTFGSPATEVAVEAVL